MSWLSPECVVSLLMLGRRQFLNDAFELDVRETHKVSIF